MKEHPKILEIEKSSLSKGKKLQAIAGLYRERGLRPIPIGQGRSQPKGCLLKKWNEEGRVFTNEEWQKSNGIGIIPGKDFIVFDPDSKDQKINEEILKVLPPPLVTRAGHPEKLAARLMLQGSFRPEKLNGLKIEFLKNQLWGVYLVQEGEQYYSFPQKHPLDLDLDRLPVLNKDFYLPLQELNKKYDSEAKKGKKLVTFKKGQDPEGFRNTNLHKLISGMMGKGENFEHIFEKAFKFDLENHSKKPYFKNKEECLQMVARIMGSYGGQWIEKREQISIEEMKGVHRAQKEKKSFEESPLIPMPGIGGEIYKFILENARIPRESFAFASSLGLMSTLSGNRFQFDQTFPNLFLLLIASTGGGKDHPLKAPGRILNQLGRGELLGPEGYGSGKAIQAILAKKRILLSSIDEASSLFEAFNDLKNTNNPVQIDILTKIWSMPGQHCSGWYSKTSGLEGACFSPFLSTLMATTYKGLAESLTPQNLEKGLGPRVLFFFESQKKIPIFDHTPKKLPPQLQDALQFFEPLQLPSDPLEIFEIPELKISPQNRKMAMELREYLFRKVQSGEEMAEFEGLFSRMIEHFNKLVSLHHAFKGDAPDWGRDFLGEEISKESLRWAFQNTLGIYRNMAHNLRGAFEIESPGYRRKLKIISYVKARSKGVSKKMISNNFRKWGKKEREMALEDAQDTGELLLINNLFYTPENEPGGGR